MVFSLHVIVQDNMCHTARDHAEVQEGTSPKRVAFPYVPSSKSPDRVQVCEAAGHCLAIQSPWWLQSQLEQAQFEQQHAILFLLAAAAKSLLAHGSFLMATPLSY